MVAGHTRIQGQVGSMGRSGQSVVDVKATLAVSGQKPPSGRRLRGGAGGGHGVRPASAEQQMQISRLMNELSQVQMQVDTLKKATGYFAQGIGVRYAWIEQHRWHQPVSVQCEVPGGSPIGCHPPLRRRARPEQRKRLSNDALLLYMKPIQAVVKSGFGGSGV